MNDLANYFSELGEEEVSVLILGHPHADPDAVGSVIVLGRILDSIGVEVRTGVPSNVSRLTKSVLDSLDEEIEVDPEPEADVVVVLDTSSLGQLKDTRKG